MARTLPLPPAGFDELPVEEKLDYVQSLWDRIAAHPEDLPVPEWHQRVIEERLAAHRADPAAGTALGQGREEVTENTEKGGRDKSRLDTLKYLYGHR
jgi:putative addiction module component (TIGR02574 family)